MVFTDIRLQNYRSYSDASFEIGPGVNIVVGPNGAGKTNLLEALMVSAIGKSYRDKDDFIIQFNKPWARIDVHTSDNETRTVKLVNKNQKTDKIFEYDNKQYKRLPIKYRHPVTLFDPASLNLLHDEPSARRNYFDALLEQYTQGYSKLRSDYRRTVAQRNALLKQGHRAKSQIFAWDIRLADLASQIVTCRLDQIQKININIDKIYHLIAGKQVKLSLRYDSKTSLDNYSSTLISQLEKNIHLDTERGFTSYGPHRDDVTVLFGDSPINHSASRGEIRTIILALKILELQILEEQTGKKPLLLLDDVFSELDGARRKALTNFLKNYQTIITTTDADVVIKNLTDKHSIIPLG